jgi:hypothetical protein
LKGRFSWTSRTIFSKASISFCGSGIVTVLFVGNIVK